MNKKQKIAVLQGGWSAEAEVSRSSAAAVMKALQQLGYEAKTVEADETLVSQLQTLQPDIIFNALHGRWGEDGCVQGLLEMLQIPYTHSGVLASAMAMHKPTARAMFASIGLQVAKGGVYSREEFLQQEPIDRPYVIKPINEGSSVGVAIVQEDSKGFTAENWPFGEEVLVEQYIPGREVQVAVLNGKALGVIEICPNQGFYDYEAKYTQGKAQHLMPAPVPAEIYQALCKAAEQAHSVLGCRGLTRSDFRYDDTAQMQQKTGQNPLFLLEINTQPGFTPLSLAPEIAAYQGISFEQLVQSLIDEARLDNKKE